MSQKSPKLLIILTILLFSAVASAAGFLVLKDKKIDFGRIFSKKTKDISASVSGILTGKKSIKPARETQVTPNQTGTNLTDVMAQLVAEQMIKTGLDPEKIDQNIDLSSLKGAENLFVLPEISDDSTKVGENNNYFQELSQIINQTFSSSTFKKSDIEVASEALESQNYEELDEYILAYKIAYDKIIKLTVPVNYRNLHKEQLAIFDITRQILEAIRNQEQDPMLAMVAIAKYPEVEELAYQFAQKIYDMAKTQN